MMAGIQRRRLHGECLLTGAPQEAPHAEKPRSPVSGDHGTDPSPGSGGTGEQREAQDDEKADDALRKRLKDANLDKDQQLL